MPHLETHYHFKLDFQKLTNIQEASGQASLGQSVAKSAAPLYYILEDNQNM